MWTFVSPPFRYVRDQARRVLITSISRNRRRRPSGALQRAHLPADPATGIVVPSESVKLALRILQRPYSRVSSAVRRPLSRAPRTRAWRRAARESATALLVTAIVSNSRSPPISPTTVLSAWSIARATAAGDSGPRRLRAPRP